MLRLGVTRRPVVGLASLVRSPRQFLFLSPKGLRLKPSLFNRYSTATAPPPPPPPPPRFDKVPLWLRLKHSLSFSFYSVVVLAGFGLSGLVVYYFVSDILLPTSDVQVFNRAFGLIKQDEECQKRLGGSKIKAFGEKTDNKWARNRPIASRRGFDFAGREHLLMQFHVEGDLAEGLVRLEMVKSDEESRTGIGHFDFRYLVLEVPGYPRHYLIDNTPKTQKRTVSTNKGFLGVKWGKSND
ncbi:hypothetical protein TRICI_003769 [Trichomonascus ciferrii]|uniref:Mitochondrial import inner membrane translocase subunit Tim21 n=1 Tax=Trichomonascus ciferrii TaxID=44093 RepID=A0A642V2X5_9ASCO|nr:hypothetical protein TRICI_003769 [Trichomonascus ciferrii]